MFCTNCGTEFTGNFCPKCGTKALLNHSAGTYIPQQDNTTDMTQSSKKKYNVWSLLRWLCSPFALCVGVYAFYLRHYILGPIVCICAILEIPQIQAMFPAKGREKITWLIGTVAILSTAYAFGKCYSDIYYIDQIRRATSTAHPGITFEEAFDNYFDHPRWVYVDDGHGHGFVEFTGKGIYNGREVFALFQFTDNGDGTFSVDKLFFEDTQQDQFTCWDMLYTAFESVSSE